MAANGRSQASCLGTDSRGGSVSVIALREFCCLFLSNTNRIIASMHYGTLRPWETVFFSFPITVLLARQERKTRLN